MSHYKPYPAYKDSGVEWLGEVPEHWEITPLWSVYRPIKRTGFTNESLLSVYRDYGVVLKASRDDNHNRASDDLGPYQLVEPGNLVTNKMKTWQGSIAVSELRGIVSPAYFIYEPIRDVFARFIHHLMRCQLYITGYLSISKGIRVGQWDLDPDRFRTFPVLFPPKEEQERIVNFLDRETARIDALIAKKTEFIELLKKKIAALASQPPDSPNLKWVRLSHVCEVISRPVLQSPGSSYTKLGLFNRGRGIFKRDETDTEDMGDSEFFWIQPGDLILSGQFAWEGAVALANEEHAGCVVSHRFPVIRGRNNEALTEYLLAYFLTSHGDFVLNDCSRGSAGRNRPLNINLLLGWKIPIPPMQIQREVERLVQLERRIGEKVSKSIDLLKKRRSALITAAVTGQIDLREST
jgi:type I restriction enzyme S subunit